MVAKIHSGRRRNLRNIHNFTFVLRGKQYGELNGLQKNTEDLKDFILFSAFLPFLYTSESDVYRRQILTSKDGPCAERNKIYIMDVEP